MKTLLIVTTLFLLTACGKEASVSFTLREGCEYVGNVIQCDCRVADVKKEYCK